MWNLEKKSVIIMLRFLFLTLFYCVSLLMFEGGCNNGRGKWNLASVQTTSSRSFHGKKCLQVITSNYRKLSAVSKQML